MSARDSFLVRLWKKIGKKTKEAIKNRKAVNVIGGNSPTPSLTERGLKAPPIKF